MAKINVISPYFINVSATNLTSAKLEIDVYDGFVNTSFTTTPIYTLTATAVNAKVSFEISELIKDYIPAEFDGDYYELSTPLDQSTTRYVDYRITEYISEVAQTPTVTLGVRAYYGYGYFEDGVNPQLSKGYLYDGTCIVKPDDSPLRVAVDPTSINSVTFYSGGEQIFSFTPSGTYRVQDHVMYLSNETSGVDSYKDRVLLDSGTFEDSFCLSQFLKSTGVYPVDTVYVDATDGISVIKVKNIEECKYTPLKLTFINKYGAYQDLWMFKTNNLSISTKEETFKRNIVVDGSYDTYKHQRSIMTKNGEQELTLNSGYYSEDYNEVFKQMLLSEAVWIEYEDKTLPVTVTDSSLAFKTSLNDKLIDYSVNVKFAFQKINNIR